MFHKAIYLFLLIPVMAFKMEEKVNVWLVGDSTMAAKKTGQQPESGWGVELSHCFNKDRVLVHNHAASGRSSKSFLKEKRWQVVLDSIRPGDYVVIQFGHNDEKPDSALHTDASTTFKQLLKRYIAETRSKGATPIVCSSIVRRHFNAQNQLKDTHGEYIPATREVAEETSTAFVDMEFKTRKLVSELGPEKSKSLFVFCKPGECPARPRGVEDSTHLNSYGARQVAMLFLEGIKELHLPIAK